MHIDGACQCEKITYEAEVDLQDVAICHCADCQRLTGTAYRVTVSTQRSQFHTTSGEPKLYVKTADNGRRRLQFFCSDCGSPIYTTGENEDAEQVGIRLGTVNQRRGLKPHSQIWCSSALAWAQDLTGLPGRPGGLSVPAEDVTERVSVLSQKESDESRPARPAAPGTTP